MIKLLFALIILGFVALFAYAIAKGTMAVREESKGKEDPDDVELLVEHLETKLAEAELAHARGAAEAESNLSYYKRQLELARQYKGKLGINIKK